MKKRYVLTLFICFSLAFVSCEELFEELFEDDTEVSENSTASNCSLDNYSGPAMDAQYESQCKAAYVYKCAGNLDALKKQCEYYKQLQRQLNLPNCPYCD